MKIVTLFGGTGFIGRYVVDLFADAGYSVKVASRRPASANFLRTAGAVGQVQPIFCNIHDDYSVQQAVRNSDVVVNLIGLLAETGKSQTFKKLHDAFPQRLVKAAKVESCNHLVHISAIGASVQAPSEYLKTKAAGEAHIFAEFPTATIIRPSIVFGIEDGFFNLFAKLAQFLPFLPLVGGGKTKFQPVYVADLAQSIMIAATDEKWRGKIIEAVGPDILTFKECLEKMMLYTKNRKPLVTIPMPVAKIQGMVFQHLPGKLLTLDQVKSLSVDNIASGQFDDLTSLGIAPTALDTILPRYLSRYQKGGKFANKSKD